MGTYRFAFAASCRLRHWAPAIFLLVSLSSSGWSQQKSSPSELDAQIDRLIRQLDDDGFDIREKAARELATIGQAAVPKLLIAAKDTAPERRERAAKALAQIREASLGLRWVSSVRRDDFNGPVSASISPEGKFLYASSFLKSGLHVFTRDEVTGQLAHIQLTTDQTNLNAPMCIRISPDGRYGIAACRGSSTIVLLERNQEAGTLEIVNTVRSDPPTGVTLKIPVDAVFSRDSKYVYVVDQAGAILAFEIMNAKKLRHVETVTGPDNCLLQACGIALNPPGTFMFVVSATASTLSVFKRDSETGKLALIQVVKDEEGDVHGLGGVFGVCCSPNGQNVYTCAGLPGKDNAISAFKVGPEGKVALLQEFVNDESELVNYNRANEIIVTPDGLSVYASGTASRSLACFDRDPKSGRLTYRATLQNEGTGAQESAGPTGLAASRDGRYLYVTIEGGSAISVFERTKPSR